MVCEMAPGGGPRYQELLEGLGVFGIILGKPRGGAGENGAPEGHPSTKEGRWVCFRS